MSNLPAFLRNNKNIPFCGTTGPRPVTHGSVSGGRLRHADINKSIREAAIAEVTTVTAAVGASADSKNSAYCVEQVKSIKRINKAADDLGAALLEAGL